VARLVHRELVSVMAAVFVVARGQIRSGQLRTQVDLCLARPDQYLRRGRGSDWAHITAFVVATSVVGFPLGFAAVLPAAAVLGGIFLVTLLYFIIADFLYIGRLAAYVRLWKCLNRQPYFRISDLRLKIPGIPQIALRWRNPC